MGAVCYHMHATWLSIRILILTTMKIGYPCINKSIQRNAPSIFRLAFYSESRLIQTVETNLKHLAKVLRYNVGHGL